MKYKIGDRVRITTDKSKGGIWNLGGEMDKWLGKVMTIRDIDEDCYKMKEDCHEHGDGWFWYDDMIDGLVDERKIVVTTDGKVTKAILYKGKKLEKTTMAICSPEDEFDFKIGAELAVKRLFEIHTDEYFTGKAVYVGKWFGSGIVGFTKGRIYNFENGTCLDDDYNRRPIRRAGLGVSELESNDFIVIKE